MRLNRAGRQAGTPRNGFEEMYRGQFTRVRSYIARRVHRDDVDDVIAETFMVALRRVDELPVDPNHLVGWLFVTAGNIISNHNRARRRHDALVGRLAAANPIAHADRDAEWTTDGFITDAVAATAFSQLSTLEQTILTLVAWDECDHFELAAILDCSPGAAKTRLSRARSRFRDRLQELLDG